MLRELLALDALLMLPMVVLFLFLGVFLGALVMAYGTRKSVFDALAQIPIVDDDHASTESHS